PHTFVSCVRSIVCCAMLIAPWTSTLFPYTTLFRSGFNESGGEIEVAGPRDVADARAVIDWALTNTDADPDRVGMAGISYGDVPGDRKSTRLNSSHVKISYAVSRLQKKSTIKISYQV